MPWLMEIYHPTFWRNLSKGGGRAVGEIYIWKEGGVGTKERER